MREILLLVAIATLFPGMVLRFIARRHRTEYARSLTWRDRAYWLTPPWKAGVLFTPDGLRLWWPSTILIYVGLFAYGIVLVMDRCA